MAGKQTKATAGKAKLVQDREPSFVGWHTSDEEEIERRHWRGLSDIVAVDSLEPNIAFFGTYRARSTSGSAYDIEIRSLTERSNSCACLDWQINGLGTCKHIEGVLSWLRGRGKRAFAAAAKLGSARYEVFPAPDDTQAIIVRRPNGPTQTALPELIGTDSRLAVAGIETLRKALADLPPAEIRYSRHLNARIDAEKRRQRRVIDRQAFLTEVEEGTASFDLVRHPLLPYQRDGMLHLAFGERALLADEMGLGKTVQAIAACALLRQRRGIRRVLVVLPASLKAEWEDQIARFTDYSVAIISGSRPDRLRQYGTDAFFVLVNYEQVLSDGPDINRLVAPDVVVLDEAQRIKNWQTKTAQAVKNLRSPYAFVLTGTPLENRIDEVYSIVQYLDPHLLGPLFRFNRDFYVLDERGRAENYKNLDELNRRLAPVMLRRRKDAVEDQLPDRTVDTYFVAMTAEQRLRYEDYEAPVARLIAIAQRRPLTPREFDRLQQLLACMRMVCDSPYILDQSCRISPKLTELENILAELLTEPGRKIIIFSEWERMLDLVRELAVEMGLDFAWHTGSVPQDRRRVEIRRFKNDPACQLFLSTDSGSVGLNLQVATAVINMDLPWNPAKLEQRIARAWRKHQTKAVTVVNLVCENSIEHRILHLLGQKQNLADGVLDGRGDLAAIKMPSGRAAFLDRLSAMLTPAEPVAAAAPPPAPAEVFAQKMIEEPDDAILLVEHHRRPGGNETILAVLDGSPDDIEQTRKRLTEESAALGMAIEMIDRALWERLRHLAAAGIIQIAEQSQTLFRAARLDENPEAVRKAERDRRRRTAAAESLAQADRKFRMATLLADGGFIEEATTPLSEAAAFALRALAITTDAALDPAEVGEMSVAALVERDTVAARLPPGTVAALDSAEGDRLRTAVQALVTACGATDWEQEQENVETDQSKAG